MTNLNSEDSGEFLQKKINEIKEGKAESRILHIPFTGDGKYIIKETLYLPSNIKIVLDPGVMLYMDPSKFGNVLFQNDDTENGNENIIIENGIYVGGMHFRNIRNVRFLNFEIRNNGFCITLKDAYNFTVQNIFVNQQGERDVNQDGVHVFGPASNGYISNIYGKTYDDMVAINADDNDGIHGEIHNILVDGLQSDNTYNFVRIMSRGSYVNNIIIRNVQGNSYENGGFDISAHRFSETANFGNITLDTINVTNKGNPGHATFKLKGDFENLILNNIARNDPETVDAFEIVQGTIENLQLSNVKIQNGGGCFKIGSRIKNMSLSNCRFSPFNPTEEKELIIFNKNGKIDKLFFSNVICEGVKLLPDTRKKIAAVHGGLNE